MSAENNVFELRVIEGRGDRPAPLTDKEILRLRAMLEHFDNIVEQCPIAKRATPGRVQG